MSTKRLTHLQRNECAARAFLGEKQSCLAEEYGISQPAVSELLRRRRAGFKLIANATKDNERENAK